MSATPVITVIGILLLLYISCGFVFMIAFLMKGITKVDETTKGSNLGFKLIIIPGIIALWPVLLVKWIRCV